MRHIHVKDTKEKHRWWHCEGFLSVFFLSLLLTISSFAASLMHGEAMLLNMSLSLQKAEAYQQVEMVILHHIKCALQQEQAIPEEMDVDGVGVLLQQKGDTIYAVVDRPYDEVFTIYLDLEYKKVMMFERSSRGGY